MSWELIDPIAHIFTELILNLPRFKSKPQRSTVHFASCLAVVSRLAHCNIVRYSCCLWQSMFVERRISCWDTSSIYLPTWAVMTEPLCWHPTPNQSSIKLLRNAKTHSQKMSISVGESPSFDGLETQTPKHHADDDHHHNNNNKKKIIIIIAIILIIAVVN